MTTSARRLAQKAREIARRPGAPAHRILWFLRGFTQARKLAFLLGTCPHARPTDNALKRYFSANESGPGIFKWLHYFEIYDRHFAKFRGREVNILEIGIFSGGSLGMWRKYFGPQCRVFGVDIKEACKVYERDGIEVLIGNQEDRVFWKRVKEKIPPLDVIIDDGGHLPKQQVVTLEELIPHLRPGGVYLCEDVHQTFNGFNLYISGLSCHLNTCSIERSPQDSRRQLTSRTTPFQAAIHSIHLYPFVVVIERHDSSIAEFIAAKHGTEWQPFGADGLAE